VTTSILFLPSGTLAVRLAGPADLVRPPVPRPRSVGWCQEKCKAGSHFRRQFDPAGGWRLVAGGWRLVLAAGAIECSVSDSPKADPASAVAVHRSGPISEQSHRNRLYSHGVTTSRGGISGTGALRPGPRERILATAGDLFYREGVRAVGIQRIINEAGIAKASLYDHFSSKDALVAACLERRAASIEAGVLEWLNATRHLDARARLLDFFDQRLRWIDSDGFRGCPFQNAAAEMADSSRAAKLVIAKHRTWLRELVTQLVADTGIRQAREVADTLMVLYSGVTAAAQVDGHAGSTRGIRWAIERLFDAAKRGRPRSRPTRRGGRG
jgi:AcrR family transcriptional regulator